MQLDEFWALITLLDGANIDDEPAEGEDDTVTEPLVRALAAREPEDIRSFDDRLAELLYELDGQAWAGNAGVCGEFEDLFLYCRCCVIANGREFYQAVLANPLLMPAGMEFERLLSVAERAWVRRTGKTYEHVPEFSVEMRANASNWPS